LQQTLLLLCPKPCKHQKITKLNLNTIKKEDDGMLSRHRLLLRHKKKAMALSSSSFLKHKEGGDGN
jgi:hypothetical protein